MISIETFRRTEQMLLAASAFLPAETLIAVIALAIEDMVHLAGDATSINALKLRFPLSALADRLGLDRRTASRWARDAGQEVRDHLGLTFVHFEIDGTIVDVDLTALEKLSDVVVVIGDGFSGLLRGSVLAAVAAGDEPPLVPDDASRAAIELVGRIVMTGAATSLLLRVDGAAGDRHSEMKTVIRMISKGLGRATPVFVENAGDHIGSAMTPAALVLAAVLHAVDPVVVVGTDILEPEIQDPDSDFDELPQSLPPYRKPAGSGDSLLAILPFAPATLLVAVPQNVVLHPDHARLFATAIGPLRLDRTALAEEMMTASGRGLSEPVAERLVGLWNGHTDRARAILDTSARILDAAQKDPGAEALNDPMLYNALVTALATGIAPHVHTTAPYRSKKRAEVFFHELFVTNPPAEELFETLSAGRPKLIMHGIPGTGKSAAAAHIAATLFRKSTMEIRSADVLFHRLGHMEKAIARAFREAKLSDAVLVFDEAEALAQNRSTSSQGNAHLATAMTNALLVELDDHELPAIFATNHLERIDPAIIRRADVVAEVLPIPENLEPRAVELILGFTLPNSEYGFGDGATVISDYASARKVQRYRDVDKEALLEMIIKARDNRLGETRSGKRFGFLHSCKPLMR